MTRQHISRVLITLLVAITIHGCQRDTPSELRKTLKVGSILCRTGPAAAYGDDTEKGVQLAVGEINASDDSLMIEYISLDDKTDKTEAVNAARQLIDVQRVHAILGPITSPAAMSVGKIAEERRVPMVSTSATQDDVTASDTYDRQYVSRVCFCDSVQGKVLAQFAAKSLGKLKAAIVYDKSLSYSIGLAATFRTEFKLLGGEILYEESFSVNDTDYSALIDKVAAHNDVELLMIPAWDENVGPMLRQAAGKWDKFVLLGGDAWPTKRLLELSGGNIRNAYAIAHYIAGDPNAVARNFELAYRARYSEDPSWSAALGYDAMMLIANAARRANTFEGPDLRDAINSSHDIPLVTGRLSFDKSRNPSKDVIIVRINSTDIVFHERITQSSRHSSGN